MLGVAHTSCLAEVIRAIRQGEVSFQSDLKVALADIRVKGPLATRSRMPPDEGNS